MKIKRKGFTLIELMIVLAIIAILAVVLVPKAGQMKNNAKNSGVVTNVNTVRGYLETKTNGSGYMNYATLQPAIDSAFGSLASTENKIVNPLTNVSGTYNADYPQGPGTGTNYGNVALDVYTTNTNITTLNIQNNNSMGSNNKGIVFVAICTDGYVIYGIDANGSVVGESIVR